MVTVLPQTLAGIVAFIEATVFKILIYSYLKLKNHNC